MNRATRTLTDCVRDDDVRVVSVATVLEHRLDAHGVRAVWLEATDLCDGVWADLDALPPLHVDEYVRVVEDAVAGDGGDPRLVPAHLDGTGRLAHELHVLRRGRHCGAKETVGGLLGGIV